MGSFDPARHRYLNLSAFSRPALFTVGNAPPRMPHVRGPAFLNEDLSIFKNLRFTESVPLQLRGEFYNVMNRVVFPRRTSTIRRRSASSADKPILRC